MTGPRPSSDPARAQSARAQSTRDRLGRALLAVSGGLAGIVLGASLVIDSTHIIGWT